MAPAGQVWSTVGDLAAWAALLAGRRPDVLSAATLAEMAAPRLDPQYGLGLRRVRAGERTLVGHTGSMPGFLASLFVDQLTGDATIALANGTTGLDCDGVPAALLDDAPTTSAEPWVPTTTVPDVVEPILGLWFWGNTAVELRWHHDALHVLALQSGTTQYTFEVRGEAIVGVSGYHRGETLRVHPTHLECATFVYTRVPYDPRAPIPGGVPAHWS